jgi:hypothetical protein
MKGSTPKPIGLNSKRLRAMNNQIAKPTENGSGRFRLTTRSPGIANKSLERDQVSI